MQFPPAWEFEDPESFETFQYRRMEDQLPGLEVITVMQGGRAGDFRLVLGGSKIISMKFGADKIFGPRFAGKQFIKRNLITCFAPGSLRIRIRILD